MSKYPVLESMGIQNPEQIARFSVFMLNNTDILRIVYNRKEGSFLPVSRKYKFPRAKTTNLVDSGTRQTVDTYNSSPQFRNAVTELETLMDVKHDADELRSLIKEEVKLLEEDVAARVNYIKSLVDRM